MSALFLCPLQHSAQSFLPSEGSVELCVTEHKILKEIGSGEGAQIGDGIRVHENVQMKHLMRFGYQTEGTEVQGLQ